MLALGVTLMIHGASSHGHDGNPGLFTLGVLLVAGFVHLLWWERS